MKKEDLKVGGIYKDDHAIPTFRKIEFFDDKTVFYFNGDTKEQTNNNALASTVDLDSFLISNEEIKEKKRYWLWDITGNNITNAIVRCSYYLNENGEDTSGYIRYGKDQLIKKHENEFVEV